MTITPAPGRRRQQNRGPEANRNDRLRLSQKHNSEVKQAHCIGSRDLFRFFFNKVLGKSVICS